MGQCPSQLKRLEGKYMSKDFDKFINTLLAKDLPQLPKPQRESFDDFEKRILGVSKPKTKN
ncbi:hypothetical protein NSMS1_64890 (plasmid) [Nostoc sp. MS1]|nr:hypothetical protein NSMS1_64890 [Nostoc sp. MS1]